MMAYDIRSRLADTEAKLAALTRERSSAERDALGRAKQRAEPVARLYGHSVSDPIPGETVLQYRRRLASGFLPVSRFAKASLSSLDSQTLGPVEDQVYADAVANARNPDNHAPGTLTAVEETDSSGRRITRYHGDVLGFMGPFMAGGSIGHFVRNPRGS